jgi:hypothetical protein
METVNKYWFDQMSPAEQLEFESWAAHISRNLPPITATRTFYCEHCNWRGKLDCPRIVEPCPCCGRALADVKVEEF